MPSQPLRSLSEQVRPAHTALLVVDVQKDYCAEDGLLAVRSGLDMAGVRAALPRLNRLVDAARAGGVTVVWVRSAYTMETLRPNHRAVREAGSGVLAAEGSAGAEFDEEVTPPLPDEPVVAKRNYDGFHETPLDSVLRSAGITTLVVAGVATNVCVETTARHGYLLGYYVVLASDCSAALDPAEHEAAVSNIARYFGKAATGAEIATAWARDPDPGR